MKKIAFIINDMRIGGAERVLANLTMGFPEQWETDIILSDARDISYPYRGNVIELGIYREKYRNAFLYFVKVLYARFRILLKLKKEKRYDVCIAFADSASVANILSGRKYCKTISTVHLALTKASVLPEYKYVVCPLVKMLYNYSDKVITVSKGIELDLIQNYKIKENLLQTIYNGCDFQSITYKLRQPLTDEEQQWLNSTPLIITMGRLDTQKAQWHLIRAFREVLQQYPTARLLLLGTGTKEAYLRKLAIELHIEESVIFCGFQQNPFHILARCQLYVFPSLFEGFSNAIIEGMYCGLPTIATDFDTGARELLAPDTNISYKNTEQIEYAEYGILVPVCDGVEYTSEDILTKEEKLLAQAVIELLTDQEKYEHYQKKAKERAELFSQEQMVEEWKQLIRAESENKE